MKTVRYQYLDRRGRLQAVPSGRRFAEFSLTMRLNRTSSLVALTLAAVGLVAGGRSVPEAAAPGGLKVMTFNIQHGIDGSDRYNLQRSIDTIAKIEPDLVGASGGHPEPSVPTTATTSRRRSPKA